MIEMNTDADSTLYEIEENRAGSGRFTGVFDILRATRDRMTAGGEP
jgi:hypothetical protein